jgi:hypothetical protein
MPILTIVQQDSKSKLSNSLNPIKMVWGYMKYCECSVPHSHPELISVKGYRIMSDGKFAMAKRLMPQCLAMCDTPTICWFFRKSWWYMDAYLHCAFWFQMTLDTDMLMHRHTERHSTHARLPLHEKIQVPPPCWQSWGNQFSLTFWEITGLKKLLFVISYALYIVQVHSRGMFIFKSQIFTLKKLGIW